MSIITENKLESELENIDNNEVNIQETRLDQLSNFIKENDPALMLRLSFHSANTFDQNENADLQGGTEGATMRFPPESTDGANRGLNVAIRRLSNFLNTHPNFNDISVADLWTKSGALSVKVTGGPDIEVLQGRQDFPNNTPAIRIPPNGRVTFPSMTLQQLRANFRRMGFNDKEMVVLSGGHTLGEAHRAISNHEGQWTKNNQRFNNEYFKNLINETWTETTTSGRGNRVSRQFTNADNTLMMLPTDIHLINDSVLRGFVQEYADDEQLFFNDFALAFSKMLGKGCPALRAPLLLDEEVIPPEPNPPPVCCNFNILGITNLDNTTKVRTGVAFVSVFLFVIAIIIIYSVTGN